MDRTIINTLEQMRDFDFVQFEHDALVGLSALARDVLSQTSTSVVAGLVATQTVSPSLTINVGAGRIYSLVAADATAVGSIAQDLVQILQQGQNAGQTLTLVAPSAGQSQWNLVQCQFSQVDAVRSGDPNGGIVPFYNAANPTVPNTQSINTVRQGLCVLQVITGSAATTGSEIPPQPSVGWTPLYLIDLAGGQTQITTSQILVAKASAGTGVPTNYPFAPFIAGLLASHHSGNAGQAPKIILTSEVQGVLPYGNMSPVRQLLSAPLNLYVATNGNNNNIGTSPGSPFLTVQAAINSAYRNYDFNGNTCTINVANGTYNFVGSQGASLALFQGIPVGLNTSISLVGNVASPGSVTLGTTTGNGITCSGGATVNISGFTITATGTNQGLVLAQGYGVVATSGARASVASCVIGSCGSAQLDASLGGFLQISGPITLTGTTGGSLVSEFGGTLWADAQTITISSLTLTTSFVLTDKCAVIEAQGVVFVNPGSATGTKYAASFNSVIVTGGGGAAYFPGTGAGVVSTGSQYL